MLKPIDRTRKTVAYFPLNILKTRGNARYTLTINAMYQSTESPSSQNDRKLKSYRNSPMFSPFASRSSAIQKTAPHNA